MEEQTTWKGHTFTLFVFTGIVVLCSIFFILGMLVGRAQGLKIASSSAPAAPLRTEISPSPNQEKQDFTFYDGVKKPEPLTLQPAPATSDPPPKAEPASQIDSALASPPEITSKPANSINYQIGAVRKSSDAERLLKGVKKKGFRAFILEPAAKDPNKYFRVQVGPIDDPVEAQEIKGKLETAGYKPILKK